MARKLKLTKDQIAIIIGFTIGILATVIIINTYKDEKIDIYPTSQMSVKG